ncbi:MHC class II regulatory factor RFX1-like isoform X1 [Schistocerca serialis cubense]|uniref:MHC class II regulatory factor RFX1-like isoform X1 n=1 Tax=Schistocerca serialis cubense TaxID=2023355 RepID=UPI00214E9E9A|nr:MHC class II regulatory factor RFX1-like isoform X1 [Schistocerca serialis cubense]
MATRSGPPAVLALLCAAAFLSAPTSAEEAREEAGGEGRGHLLVPFHQANTALLHRAAAITGVVPDSAAVVAAASLQQRPQAPDQEQPKPARPAQLNDEPPQQHAQGGQPAAKLASHGNHPEFTGVIFRNHNHQEPVEEPFQKQQIPVSSDSAGALPHHTVPNRLSPHQTPQKSSTPEAAFFQQAPHLAAIAVAPPPHFQQSLPETVKAPYHHVQHQPAQTVQAAPPPQHPMSAQQSVPQLQQILDRQTGAEVVPGRRTPYLPSPAAAAPKQPLHRGSPVGEEAPSRQTPYFTSPAALAPKRPGQRVPQVVEAESSFLPRRTAAALKEHAHHNRPAAGAASFHHIHHIVPVAATLPLHHFSHHSAYVGAAPLQHAHHSAPADGAASHHKATHASSGAHGGGGHGGSGAGGKSSGGSSGSGGSSHHHKESGERGSSGSEKSQHSSVVEKGGGSSHSESGGHASHHHKQDGGAHGHKYKGGGHKGNNAFSKGYRDKYHKDEHHHLDDFWSNGQEKGGYHKYGEQGSHFSEKGKKKESAKKATKGGSEGKHGSAGKSGKGHATSDKSGHAAHGGRSSSHEHSSQYAKNGGHSSHKKTSGGKQ